MIRSFTRLLTSLIRRCVISCIKETPKGRRQRLIGTPSLVEGVNSMATMGQVEVKNDGCRGCHFRCGVVKF